jgi:hypothetical protein
MVCFALRGLVEGNVTQAIALVHVNTSESWPRAVLRQPGSRTVRHDT